MVRLVGSKATGKAAEEVAEAAPRESEETKARTGLTATAVLVETAVAKAEMGWVGWMGRTG